MESRRTLGSGPEDPVGDPAALDDAEEDEASVIAPEASESRPAA
jgi:hypothetical protein